MPFLPASPHMSPHMWCEDGHIRAGLTEGPAAHTGKDEATLGVISRQAVYAMDLCGYEDGASDDNNWASRTCDRSRQIDTCTYTHLT